MKTLKTRLVKWARLVAGTCRETVNPGTSVLEHVAHAATLPVLAQVAFVAVVIFGR